jgi:PAS domain S-box-containing protein
MHYQNKVFNSKISKRIFTTFIICALAPVVCLAVLSYSQVTNHIENETYRNLRHAVKAQAKILTDRLIFYEKEFELIGSMAEKDDRDTIPRLPDHLRDRLSKTFNSITYFSALNQPQAIFGNVPINFLRLEPDDILHLAAGYTLLVEHRLGQSAPLFLMVRPVFGNEATQAFYAGEIQMDDFWSSDVLDHLPMDSDICVFGFSGNLLYNSSPTLVKDIDSIRLGMHSSISGHFEISMDEGQYLASHTQLFLKPSFKLPYWDVVLFRSKSDVFAPVADFKKVFPLVLSLAFIVVLWLSIAQIRRHLVPIDALKSGVHRIANKDFAYQVDIKSGDELEELADAFNRMSDQLRKKFNELNLIAGLGTKITTILETEDLSQTVINLIQQNLDFTCGSILLMESSTKKVFFEKSFGFNPTEIERIRNIDLQQNTPQDQNPIQTAYASQKPVLINNYQTSDADDLFRQSGTQAIFCIPIVYEDKPLGVLLLVKTTSNDELIQASDVEVLTGITAQTAVSLTNINAFRKIQESEQRFRAAFDYSAGGILFIHPEGRLLRLNTFFCDMLGYPEEELMSKPFSEIVHSKHLTKSLASLTRMINGEISSESQETRYLHKNGSEVWSFVSTSLLRDKNGNPLYFICLVQDLSDQKKSQKEKQVLEAQLQQSQKMEAIGTLAGGIAHDFNNILSAIYGYTQLSMMDTSVNDNIHSHLKKILQASERATALVKQILTFSRRGKSETSPVKISSVIKETVKLLRATIPPNIEITQNISVDSVLVLADPNQIHQVIMNLCTNAYHAVSQKGSGSIKIESLLEHEPPDGLMSPDGKKPIQPHPPSCLKLSISDNGCGMDSETVNRIFDPYFTTKEEGKGTGLGLSVVHGIIKNHGGVINVHSVPGEGTTFDIFLSTTETDEGPDVETPKNFPTGRERVLVVDDESDVTRIYEMMLTRLGYSVTSMRLPMEALMEFQSNPDRFDLVITDMAMPKMMGNELAAEIKKVRPGVPIICSTGYCELSDDKKSSEGSFMGYITKPVTYENLANIVRDTIDLKLRQPSP